MPILTTHAGSLPRPVELDRLFALRSREADAEVDGARFEQLISQATMQVVEAQRRAGLDVINNGEAPRESFFTYVRERLSGFGGRSHRSIMADRTAFPSFVELKKAAMHNPDRVSAMSAPACCAAVTHRGLGPVDAELDGFAAALDAAAAAGGSDQPPVPVATFVTAASPGIVAAAMDNGFYPDDLAYVDTVGAALAPEYRRIVERGHVLQIDAPDLAMERHTRFAGRPLEDFISFVDTVVAAINRAIDGLDPRMLRLHVCWGNYDGPHHLDVELAAILPSLSQARVGWLVLPFANPRHAHEHRLLDQLPPSMGVVAGVIETTHNYVEHPEVVAERLERIATSLGDPTRLQAGTDCGFATFAGYGEVAREIVWEKLRSLVSGTALANERLIGAR